MAAEIPSVLLSEFKPLPKALENPANPLTPAKVTLGKMLYFEPRISRDQKISCNSCHDLARFGVDGQPTSPGFPRPARRPQLAHDAQRRRPLPAVLGRSRAADVEAQAAGPMLNPVEMAAPTPVYVANVLKSMPEYVEAFQKAFPGQSNPVTITNAAVAIAAFERTLVTPSRWDKFLSGDATALNDAEKQGFLKFVEKGCNTCHTGVLVGGQEFRKLGTAKAWPDKHDTGRAKVTQQRIDEMMFKVPSLRNIARTGPYLHNGSIVNLGEVIVKMGEYQTGKKLTQAEAAAIETWLGSLTGTLPSEVVQAPPTTAFQRVDAQA